MLTIELVPVSTWGDNLRSRFKPSAWDRLRRECYAAAGHKCEVCGGVGPKHPVEAHEVWDYDGETHTQRLVRLIALCPACHEVKHFGRAMNEGNMQRAFEHLRRVNGWSPNEAEAHVQAAFKLWAARCAHEWTIDISAVR